jgi:hypothetical protein
LSIAAAVAHSKARAALKLEREAYKLLEEAKDKLKDLQSEWYEAEGRLLDCLLKANRTA